MELLYDKGLGDHNFEKCTRNYRNLYKLYIRCERDSTCPVEWIQNYFSPDLNPDFADPTLAGGCTLCLCKKTAKLYESIQRDG